MATIERKIKRVHKNYADIIDSGIIDQQFAFATDIDSIIARDGSNYYSIGNAIGWDRTGTILSPENNLENVAIYSANYLSFNMAANEDWSNEFNRLQFGGDDNYMNTFFQTDGDITTPAGWINNGAYFDGTDWINGADTGYAWRMSFRDAIVIKRSTSNVADSTITYSSDYIFDFENDAEITNNYLFITDSGTTVLDASNNGIAFGSTLSSSGNAIEINNLASSTKLRFLDDAVMDDTLVSYTSDYAIRITIKSDSQTEYTRYIPLLDVTF